jgi:protein-tyrosine phosphatase
LTEVRRIALEGCFNFRDLGGWSTGDGRRVRWERLYRADSVHLMSEDDAVQANDELGIRTLLDLRNELEIHATGTGLLAEQGLTRHHLPLTSRDKNVTIDSTTAAASSDRSPETLTDQYLRTLEVSSDLILSAIETLAEDDSLPAVFFCAAGKDRTGVLSATVLGSLGVRDEDIIRDYVLTEEAIVPIIERFAASPGAPAMYRDLPPSHFAPYAETMEGVIAGVRDVYGSFAEYVVDKGLDERALNALRRSLLDA